MGQAHDVLERARTARLEGRYEDALRDHLWFHENALAVEPGLAGVRLSFALRDWIYLAEQFPLARRALQGLRDRDTERMLNGGESRELFRDIVAINSALGEERATQDLFVRHPTDPGRWRVLGRADEQIMLSSGEKVGPPNIPSAPASA